MNAKASSPKSKRSRGPKQSVWRTPIGASAKTARRQERAAELDQQFVNGFAGAIVREFPGCPPKEASRIAEHACLKSSGRVGRSAAAKQFDPEAVRLAVVAAVRHQFTDYDRLLLNGMERHEARALVSGAVERKLEQWRQQNAEHQTANGEQ